MTMWLDLSWSDWIPLTRLEEVDWAMLRRGVYAIGAGLHDGEPISIQRTHGFDTQGVLFFGEGNLAFRLGELANLVAEDCDNQRYFATDLFAKMSLSRIFDRRALIVRWSEAKDSKSVYDQVLGAYQGQFGELPSGNSQSVLRYLN